jgi:hypothetical protein
LIHPEVLSRLKQSKKLLMEWDSARLEMTPIRYQKITLKINKVNAMAEITENIYPMKTGLSVLS